MSVEFVPAAHVHELAQRIQDARQRAVDECGPPPAPGADEIYWQTLFERNAAAVLAEVPSVTLPSEYVVRYRFFGMRERDLLVRPFVARAATDVEPVRRLLDWHEPPDARSLKTVNSPSQDVELLYRHFSFPLTALGYYEYWLVLQELWASKSWAHSRVIATPAELSQIVAAAGWDMIAPVQVYEPAVVVADNQARLAVLMESPLERFSVYVQQVDIGVDQAPRYAEPVVVASGPKGYFV